MNKLSFQQKLWVPLLCSLLCITAIFLFETIQTRNVRMEERQNDLRSLDDLALNIVKQYGDKAAAGTLSKEDAQKQAMDLIRGLRYAKDGYFTISSGTKSLMHPIKPENNGKDLVDLKDPKGTYVYRAIAATGAMPEGGGFVSYYWSRPGSNEPVPKMSRVVHYEPWGWDLVTGVYTDDIDTAFRESLLVSAGWLALVCVLLWVVVSLVNKSLRHTIGGDPEYVGEVTRTIAEGDLSVDVKVHESDQGSILHSVKAMQQRLAETIREIRHSADTIATASGEIASGNMDLSARTESQASSLEETAASMEELTSTVTQNADNAVQANQLVQSASEVAERGGKVVSQVVQTMETINASATRIVDIISVIDGIAFQTNILALNAAVEAARAGEQGRGFAVVASEVRNLAQRSAAAAKEIKELINASVDSIGAGSALVAEAGTTMDQVVTSVSRVTQIMSAITDASSEQSTGIGHVNMAITEMDSVTQQNAALVEEAAAAAGSMQEQAATLAALVARFKLSGDTHAPAAPRARAATRRTATSTSRQIALAR
ncbi:methyl-accepting chemotaxis sensory transducer with Cache sensor [Duganella sacchari]|uniref:Methyl-accepting chemotaxis sensory transducer with Cache sensor n=1 Tax=Duganella sacchari TaxID=551987 RepID=A0A1M7N474_9BURK|nr:methyl-accepting chemotaxis protein [Duganella sacchari]SHM98177.1 methyl-accepting chemotaxis sensory transducer with Cache sensor [Duganella sacchari]